ncbi:MAG: AAA family ATPase [Acidimicrobiales bacterium]
MAVILGLVAVFTLTRDKVYESEARVQILTEFNQAVFNTRSPELFRRPIAELQYMDSSTYYESVNDRAGFPVDYGTAVALVDDAEPVEEAGILVLTVQDADPERAAVGAEAAAEAYLELRHADFVGNFERVRNDLDEQRATRTTERTELSNAVRAYDLQIVSATDPAEIARLTAERDRLDAENSPRIDELTGEIGTLNAEIAHTNSLLYTLSIPDSTAMLSSPAEVNRTPVYPDVKRNLLLGFAAGLFVALVMAVLRDLLDSRARDGAELAHLVDVPVMASVRRIRSQRGAPGGVRRYADLSSAEASGYQVLLNSLWLTNVDEPIQSIVVTSDRPEAGKTQTVVNLAQAEAERGTRVLVIDADFDNPSVAARLGLDAGVVGLADVLAGSTSVAAAVTSTGHPNLDLLASPGSGEEACSCVRIGSDSCSPTSTRRTTSFSSTRRPH